VSRIAAASGPPDVPAKEEKLAETHKVAITGSPGNFSFDPNSLTIKAGDTVEWTNQTGRSTRSPPTKMNFQATTYSPKAERFHTSSPPPLRSHTIAESIGT
jgi:plastocyanin